MRFATPDNRRQTPTDLNNWGPRFGFAYQFTQKIRISRRIRADVFRLRNAGGRYVGKFRNRGIYWFDEHDRLKRRRQND